MKYLRKRNVDLTDVKVRRPNVILSLLRIVDIMLVFFSDRRNLFFSVVGIRTVEPNRR